MFSQFFSPLLHSSTFKRDWSNEGNKLKKELLSNNDIQ